MKFTVLSKSYLFGELLEAGSVYDYPDDKIPRSADGSIQFEKMSQLEPVKKTAVKSAEKVDEDGGSDDSKKVDAPSGDERAQMIKDTVKSLDKTVDAHWTKAGLPNVETIGNLLGFTVSRKEVDAVAPDFIRPAE